VLRLRKVVEQRGQIPEALECPRQVLDSMVISLRLAFAFEADIALRMDALMDLE
jgi:hypothetical protein